MNATRVLTIFAIANVAGFPFHGEGGKPRTLSDASPSQLGERAKLMSNAVDKVAREARTQVHRPTNIGTMIPMTQGMPTDIYMNTGEAPFTHIILNTDIHNAVDLTKPISIIEHINYSIRLISNHSDYHIH